TPTVMMRPILLPVSSANQMAPSGPATIPLGEPAAVGTGNSVITPAVVMRPILLLADSANQRSPSGPSVMPMGELEAVGTLYSVKLTVWAIRLVHSWPRPAKATITRNSFLRPQLVVKRMYCLRLKATAKARARDRRE